VASIVKRRRKDGAPSYFVKYRAGDGRVRWERFGRAHDAQARKAEVELELARSARQWSPPTSKTFDEVADEWEKRNEHRLADRTLHNARGILRKHLRPAFGTRPVATLKRSDVEAFAAGLAAVGMAEGSIGQVLGLLRQILTGLVRDGELTRNVAFGIGRYGRKTARPTPPTPARLTKVLRTMTDEARPVVELAAATGLRRGEVFALRWTDVDFAGREITVRRSKTEAGARTVPMFGSVRKLLLEQRARSRFKRPEDYVFGTLVGTLENGDRWVMREWMPALKRAGLESAFRFHDLRHFAVSRQIEQGANILLVSRVAGHSRPSMTLDVYGHLLVDGLAEAANRFDPLASNARRLRVVDHK
jgi:integrase